MFKISASFFGKTDLKLSYKASAQPFTLHAASNLLHHNGNFFFRPSNGGSLITLPLSSILDSFSNFKFQILFDRNSCALQIFHSDSNALHVYLFRDRFFPLPTRSSSGLRKLPLSIFPRCCYFKVCWKSPKPLSSELSSSSYLSRLF